MIFSQPFTLRRHSSVALLVAVICFAAIGSPRLTAQEKNAAKGSNQPSHLEILTKRQEDLSDKYSRLEALMLKMAEIDAPSNPRRAALLKKAVQQSKSRLTHTQLESVVRLLRQIQLKRATDGQSTVQDDLQALLKLLQSENRADRIKSERERIEEYIKEVNRILRLQKDVQGRTEGKGDSKRLAKDQDKIAKRTDQLAKKIQKNEENAAESEGKSEGKGQGGGEGQKKQEQQNGNPARKRIAAAEERMRQAKIKLEKANRKEAIEEQKKAKEELELAKAELEEILRQLREEEIERVLAMLEGRFRRMLEMQLKVYESTILLDKIPIEKRTREVDIRAGRLAFDERKIVNEVDKALVLLIEDGSSAAFPEAVSQMREDIEQVSHRLAHTQISRITQGLEEDIIAALEEIVEALQKAQQDMSEKKPPQPPQKPGQSQEPGIVDQLAELKMIRALQMRINKRTKRYAQLLDNFDDAAGQATDEGLIDALDKLGNREERIQRVTRDIAIGKNK